MTPASFDAVAALGEVDVRDLLAHGTAMQRVWAAWALGLRRGTAGSAELARLPAHEPDAGVRRHVVVMLAAFGETTAVTALAVDDPDAWVRATACQYLVRLAAATPALWTTIVERLSDAPVVREAIIQQLPKDMPAFVRAAAVAYVADPTREIRKAVIEQLSNLLPGTGRVPRAIVRRTTQEPDAQLRAQLMLWRIEREGVPPLLDQLATPESSSFALEALAVLQDRLAEVPLPWLLEQVGSRPHWQLGDGLFDSLVAHFEHMQPGDVPPESRPDLAELRRLIADWKRSRG